MKGLILSGGSGTRLRPLTYTSARQRRIDASLIGRDARVYGAGGEPRAHRLMIGDRSTVGISE